MSRRRMMLSGKDLKFNQLVQNGNFADETVWRKESGVTFSVSNNVATIYSSVRNNGIYQYFNLAGTHKIFFTVVGKGTSYLRVNWAGVGMLYPTLTSEFAQTSAILTASQTGGNNMYLTAGTADMTMYLKNIMAIDLTEMYGEGNEPTTVAEVEADCRAIGHGLSVYQPYTPIT